MKSTILTIYNDSDFCLVMLVVGDLPDEMRREERKMMQMMPGFEVGLVFKGRENNKLDRNRVLLSFVFLEFGMFFRCLIAEYST